ncbi:MAG: SGNH/GDSL hydrolase family protein [Microlunatus sp.]|nr:SGNH/GDSL hydrolase family protein [Microlunatus sp.]
MQNILRSAIVVAATAVLLVALAAAPARAATSNRYVALGDSYSAGVGTRDRQDDCYRSPYGYPALIAAHYGLTLDYQACKGATTADVQADQVPALSSRTTLVSMTIGGNDAGFKQVLAECALPSWISDCADVTGAGLAVVRNDLPGRYDALFAAIRSRAPRATVVIGDYPLIFQGQDCNALTFFSPDDERRINSATWTLDDLIMAEAAAYGFGFAEARTSFAGHAVCDDPEWINGLSNPISESYHPNRDGNVGYAAVFGLALTGRPYPAPDLLRTTLSSIQHKPSLQDRAGTVLAMRLDSPANLARARRHGISPGRVRRLVGMLRTGDPARTGAALVALQRLDRRAR